MIENSQQLAGGCAEKCGVIIMCTLQHSVSFVVTSHYDLSRGGNSDLCVREEKPVCSYTYTLALYSTKAFLNMQLCALYRLTLKSDGFL